MLGYWDASLLPEVMLSLHCSGMQVGCTRKAVDFAILSSCAILSM